MNIQKITKTHLFPKGFTLIELIVVITILAILGTIGFLSIGGYSSKARDSSRISDVANISKSLDVSIITVGTYPTPDNFFAVTYSGGTIWNQGVIGTTVLQSLRTSIAGGGLSKKPVDPLDNSEYEYSSLAFGKAYQIKAEYEGDLNQTAWNIESSNTRASSTLTSLLASNLTTVGIEEAKAAPGSPSIAYIKGNYGGLMARTITGSYTYILAIPSIMTSTGTASAILKIDQADALSGTLLFNGKSLRNASAFNPNLTPVFSGSGKVLTTSAEITILMTNLKNTYTSSGTPDVLANTNIASLIAMNTGSLTTLGNNLVKNDLGITDGSGGGTDTTTTNACSPGTYSATGNAPCNTTTAGYYTSSTGATIQIACTAGYFCTAGSKSATQSQCPANSYCPAGTGTPIACTGGTTSPAGSTSVGACVGTFLAGTFNGVNILAPKTCASGDYYCQAKLACETATKSTCTWQSYTCSSYPNQNGSFYPSSDPTSMGIPTNGSSNLNWTVTSAWTTGGNNTTGYGNLCACYNYAAWQKDTHPGCGVGRWEGY